MSESGSGDSTQQGPSNPPGALLPPSGGATPPTVITPNVFSMQSVPPQVNQQTGALIEKIPLDIPPGRNGMQPDLALDYNSQDTDQGSEVGYGWSLSIPFIERLNKTGSENLYGSNAYFTSSLDGELAVASSTATSSQSTVKYFGEFAHGGHNDWLNADQLLCTPFTSPSDAGTLTAISQYWNLANTALNVKYVIYNNAGTLIATSGPVAISATGWATSTISATLSSSTVYCLGDIFQSNPAGNTAYDYQTSGTAENGGTNSYSSPTNATFSSISNYTQTIYAAYTPTGSTTAPSSTSYVARVDDGSFRNYTYSTSTNSWTMYDKRGNEYLFGSSTQSQEYATTSSNNVYKWMLEKVIDPNGNYIRYVYNKDDNQIYPYQIIYTGHNSTDGPITITFATSTRSDKTINLLPGFEVDTNYNISQITAAVNGSTTRQYNLSYSAGNNGQRSLLASVQENGWNDQGQETTLPPLAFSYVSSSTPVVSAVGTGTVSGDPYIATDVSGDGINDSTNISCNSGTEDGYIFPNATASTTFTPPQVDPLCWSSGSTATGGLNETGTRFIDVFGNGKAAIVQGSYSTTTGNVAEVYKNNYATSTGYSWSTTTVAVVPYFVVHANGSYYTSGLLGDLNGTGFPSFVFALASTTGASTPDGTYFGNGEGWDNETTSFFPPPFTFAVGTDCTDSQLVDLNGDGLADWIYTDGTSTYAYLNTGTGWATTTDSRWVLPFSLVYKSGGNCYDRGIRFVDVNGDGLADVIQSYNAAGSAGLPESGTEQFVYLNTGNGWATSTAYTLPYIIDNPTGSSTVTYQELANFQGNGQQDQDVLSTILYPHGGSTDITYGYTTESSSSPQLPYNLLVVTKLVNHDGFGSNEETDYSYTGGLQYLPTNAFDRKFAGFASITASTTESDVTTYYSQGATSTAIVPGDQSDGYGELGYPYRKDTFTPAGTRLQSIFYQYNSTIHGDGQFVGLTRQLEQDYDASGSHDDKDVDYAYSTSTDDLTKILNYGQVTGNSDGTFSSSSATSLRTTDITYAASSSINLTALIERTLFDSGGATTTDTKYFYDGLSFGQVSLGNQTEEQDLISTSSLTYASSTKTYNSYGLVATSTDRDGNATAYSYDSFNLYPATTTNALSQSTSNTYNYSNGKVEETVNPNGGIAKSSYDGLGRLTEIDQSDPSNPSSLLTKSLFTYIDGTTTSASTKYFGEFAHGGNNDWLNPNQLICTPFTSPSDAGTLTSISQYWNVANTALNVKYVIYSNTGTFIAASSPVAISAVGWATSTISAALSPSTAYCVGDIFQTNPSGNTAYDYHASASAENDGTNSYSSPTNATFSSLSNYTQTIYAAYTPTGGGTPSSPEYSVEETDYLNSATSTLTYNYYDGLDRLIQERRSTENSGTFAAADRTYDPAGMLASQSLPYFSSGSGRSTATTTVNLYTKYTYDPLERALTMINAVGTTTNVYAGWKTTTADPNRNVKDYILDAFGNLAQVVEHLGATNATTTYTYDTANNLTNISDAAGNVRNFTYDALANELTAQDLHASGDSTFGSWSYSYDPQSNLTSETDPDGHTITHTYDALNRMLTESLTGSGTQVTDTYDSCTDGIGELCSASSTGAVDTYAYDVIGRTADATTTVGGVNYGFAYGYDRQGNVTSVTNNTTGSQTNYTYNTAGLVSAVNRTISGVSSLIALMSNFAPIDELGQVVFGSGASTTYSYNPSALYRLSRIYTLGTTTQTLQDLNYTYDANGNILTRTDNSNSGGGQVVAYTYDALNRLTSASTTVSNTGSYYQLFSYDSLGNLLTGPAGAYSYQGNTGSNYANPDAVTQILQEYVATSSYITHDNSEIAGNTTPASSLTLSYTTNGNTNGLLVVGVQESARGVCATDQVTGVTYDGSSLTDMGYFVTNATVDTGLKTYYEFAPAQGTHNIVVSANNSCIIDVVAGTYNGVKQGDMPDASGTGNPLDPSGLVTTFQATTTTSANSAWAILIGSPGAAGTATAGPNTTIRQQGSTFGTIYYGDSGGPISPAGAVGLSWTMPLSTHWLANYFSIAPAGQYIATTTPTATTTYSYDQNGNLTSYVTVSTSSPSDAIYTYDYLNRLTQSAIWNGVSTTTTTYSYDAFSNRVAQTTGSTTTAYPTKYYSVVITTGSGTSTIATSTDYVFLPAQAGQSDRLLATIDQPLVIGAATGTPITRYVHTDNLGSTAVTSDTNGDLAEWFDYAPYGSLLQSSNTGTTTVARQYIGQYSDSDGLSYFNARYLNPVQGQFLSQDPVFLGEPKQQSLQDPQSLNAYSYSDDNPITKEDPLGKYFQVSMSGTGEGLSGSIGVQFTIFPVAANVVAAGGFGAGLEGSPFSFAYSPGPVPQDTGMTVSLGGDAVYGAGLGADVSGTYVPETYSLENPSTSYSFVVGGGADVYIRKQYSISVLGGPAPQGLTLVSTSNFSTPNYVATSPQIYYSSGTTYLSAPLHAVVPQAPTVATGGGSGDGGSLPSTVSQGGVTYYRNSSGLLSLTPGH